MNTGKFDRKGKVYAKARPDYPKALFEFLISEQMLGKEKDMADIGSGTGIFTAQLSPFVKTVFAIEPNDDMRNKAEDRFKPYPNIASVNATAENTTLPNTSVDLITVAQAFHWFDRKAFKNECKRILKPNGKILLVWNDRDISSNVIKDNFAVNKIFCPNFKGSSNGIDFSKDAFKDFFDGEYEMTEFDNCLVYERDAFIARSLSSSYSPKKNDPAYDEYVKALESVFEKHQTNGTVKYPYITRCYIGTVK